jgi:hypothetical protein
MIAKDTKVKYGENGAAVGDISFISKLPKSYMNAFRTSSKFI